MTWTLIKKPNLILTLR